MAEARTSGLLVFADQVRQARLRVGLSQHALARRAGIDPAYVNRIEAAPRDAPVVPRRAVVESLSTALDLTRLETDRLLLSAGMAPARLTVAGVWSATLSLVADVLSDERL